MYNNIIENDRISPEEKNAAIIGKVAPVPCGSQKKFEAACARRPPPCTLVVCPRKSCNKKKAAVQFLVPCVCVCVCSCVASYSLVVKASIDFGSVSMFEDISVETHLQ